MSLIVGLAIAMSPAIAAPQDRSSQADVVPVVCRQVSVWTLRGTVKREAVRVQLPECIVAADRERVWLEAAGGEVEILSAPGSWAETQRAQVEQFVAEIASGGAPPGEVASQLPTLRFIERCYALAWGDGLRGES